MDFLFRPPGPGTHFDANWFPFLVGVVVSLNEYPSKCFHYDEIDASSG